MRKMGDPGCDNETVSPTPAQHARAPRIAAEITPASPTSASPCPAPSPPG